MRKSAAVKLTLVPMLAASALAYADPPGQTVPSAPPADAHQLPLEWLQGAPGNIEPVMSPPGMTPTIDELDCDEDPNSDLRTDCTDGELLGTAGGPYVVVRGGYGHYFWTGGG
jgi:hypothetical protein